MRAADAALVRSLIRWFDVHERPLPWRATTPWGVLVSEFMLQQTPVDRVLPVWHAWMDRWPTPCRPRLGAASPTRCAHGDASATPGEPSDCTRARSPSSSGMTARCPDERAALRELPGVGDYTAAAVLAFAFGRRSIVLDTNVRRVLSRTVEGVAQAPAHITTAERQRADALWPAAHGRSARWSAAVMEFGAVVCTARRPACESCPVRGAVRLDGGRAAGVT